MDAIEIKYVLYPRYITKPNGSRCFIDYQQLKKCYQLDDNECVKFASKKWVEWRGSNPACRIIKLYPRPAGDYQEHLDQVLRKKRKPGYQG